VLDRYRVCHINKQRLVFEERHDKKKAVVVLAAILEIAATSLAY
jgi:hypothetical protein